MLQAALRGVYVSAGSYDLALHGIDNVEMRRVELLSENRLQKPSTSVAILLKFPLRRAKWRAQRFSSLLIMTENEAVSGSRSPLRLRPYPSRGTHG